MNSARFLFALCLSGLFYGNSLYAQEVLWVNAYGNATTDEIAFDANGGFWRFVQHGNDYQLGDSLIEQAGRVLVKQNADGTVAFIQDAGLTGTMRADKNGNMYIIARYIGKVSIQNIQLEEPTGYGLAILKYNPRGRLLWAKTYNGSGRINILEMAVVKHNVKFAFNYETSVSCGTDTLKTGATYGVAVGFLDSSGTLVKNINNILDDQLINGVFAFAENGNISVGSAYRGSVVINGKTYTASGSRQNVVVATFDNNHNFQWAHNYESVEPSIGFSTRLTAMAYVGGDSLIVGGVFKDQMKANGKWYYGGSEEGYFIRYTSGGSFQWIKQIPMEGPQRIIPISNGRWVTGATLGKYDDPSTDSCKVGYNDDRSVYVGTFNAKGECVTIKTFGGSRDFFLRGGLDAHTDGRISLKGRAYSSLYYGNNIQYRVTNNQIDFSMILGKCVAPKIGKLSADMALCEGESVTLKPQFFGQVQNLAWVKNGIKVNPDYRDENYVIDSISDSTAGDYWLRLTGACGIDSMKITVDKPKTKPSVVVMASDTFCEGTRAQAILNFTGTPPFAYSVLEDQVEKLYSTASMADTLTFNDAILLKPVSIEDKYCSAQLGTDSIQFVMENQPVSEFTVNITDFSVKFRSQATFHDKLIWDFGDGTTLTDDRYPKHTYSENGTYTVSLIAENECGADTLIKEVVIDVVSVSLPSSTGISLFPNPANGSVVLQFDGNSQLSYSIFNAQGRLEKTGTLTAQNQEIDITDLVSGSYHIMVRTNDGQMGVGHLLVE